MASLRELGVVSFGQSSRGGKSKKITMEVKKCVGPHQGGAYKYTRVVGLTKNFKKVT